MMKQNSTVILMLLVGMVLTISLAHAGDKTETSQASTVTTERPVPTTMTTPTTGTTPKLSAPVSRAAASPASGEEINWQVISSGGTEGTSTNFVLKGTLGQTAVGHGSSTNYGLSHGFWQQFGCCIGIRGNVDGDGADACNVADLTYLVDFLFFEGPVPPCTEEGDVDGSGAINVADLTYLVDYLFFEGPDPAQCP